MAAAYGPNIWLDGRVILLWCQNEKGRDVATTHLLFDCRPCSEWLLACRLSAHRLPQPPVSTTGGGGDIEVTMWASSRCARAGDTIHLRATAINRGPRVWLVELQDQPVFDIETSSNGDTVHWSDGKPMSELSRLELKPGESRTLEMDVVVPKNQNYGSIGAIARYIYSSRAPSGPARPGVMINIGSSCPGPLGP